jgi:hypothetical protein
MAIPPLVARPLEQVIVLGAAIWAGLAVLWGAWTVQVRFKVKGEDLFSGIEESDVDHLWTEGYSR